MLKMDARREYEPIARIPRPEGHRDDHAGVSDYAVENLAFNATGDRLEVVRRLPSPVDDEVTHYAGSNKGLEEWDASGHWEVARTQLLPAPDNLAVTPRGTVIPAVFESNPSAATQLFRGADGQEVAAAVKSISLQAGLFGDAHRLLEIGEGSATVQGAHDKKIQVPFSTDLANVVDATITPDGKYLVLAGEGIGLYVLEGEAYRLVKSVPISEPASKVGLTPDGRILVTQTAEAGVVQVWRTADGREVTPKALRELSSVTSWELSRGGRFLAVSGHGKTNGVYVWRLADGLQLGPVAHPYKVPVSLFFSPGERFLLTADANGKASLMDLSTGNVRNVNNDEGVTAAAFSEDDLYVGVGTEEGFLLVYATKAPDNEVARLRHVGRVRAVAFSADGRRIVTASEHVNPYHLGQEEEVRVRVWHFRPEDLVAEAEKRLAGLPAYAR